MMIHVGQKLYLYRMDARHRSRPPVEVTVWSVGRKWASIDDSRRINKDTLWVDAGNYTSDERCYQSVEERQNELALDALWGAFRKQADSCWHSPTSNPDNIRQAAALLNLNLS